MNDSYIDDRKLHEECGVFGAYDFDCGDVASTIYYGLFALQHRGQESCGIAVSDTEGPKGKVLSHKDMGQNIVSASYGMPPILYKFIAFELHYTFKLHYSGALIQCYDNGH